MKKLERLYREAKFREEVFAFLAARFDIDKAKKLARNKPVRTTDPKKLPLRNMIRIDEKYAMTTDLSKPGIMAHAFDQKGKSLGHILIDGYHRAYKADKTGKKLKIQLLDEKDSKKIQF